MSQPAEASLLTGTVGTLAGFSSGQERRATDVLARRSPTTKTRIPMIGTLTRYRTDRDFGFLKPDAPAMPMCRFMPGHFVATGAADPPGS
jgi:hypothetical protein